MQAREVGSVDVVTPLVLRSEDELDLPWLIHNHRIDADPGRKHSAGADTVIR